MESMNQDRFTDIGVAILISIVLAGLMGVALAFVLLG